MPRAVPPSIPRDIASGSWARCGGYLYTAKKAEGPWRLQNKGLFLHDGSVLFDDDGKVYMFHGTGYVTEMKPDLSGIVSSDEFEKKILDLRWQWNHIPDESRFSLTERAGWLRLKTVSPVENLFMARNTLTQRMIGPECTGTVLLDVSRMLKGDRVFFKVFGNFNNRQDYAQIGWSEDGQTWQMAQQKVPMRFDTGKFFMDAKFALFNYATKEVGGLADFDYFRVDAPLHEVR